MAVRLGTRGARDEGGGALEGRGGARDEGALEGRGGTRDLQCTVEGRGSTVPLPL